MNPFVTITSVDDTITDDSLTIRQRDFLVRYLDRNSPTYGNKTRSYMAAYGNDNYASSAVSANRLLKKPRIKEEVNRVLTATGLDIEVRARKLAEFIKRPDIGVTIVCYDPKTGQRTTKSGPKYSDVIKILNMIDLECGYFTR